MENLQLSPPWVTYSDEMKALFAEDEGVRVVFDHASMKLTLYVESSTKAEALEQLLAAEKDFGGTVLRVEVVPGNSVSDKYVNLYATAFESNPALEDTKTVKSPFGTFFYVIWRLRPAQFFNDNLADYQGKKTMLMEDIAKDVLAPQPNVFHCTADGPRFNPVTEVWP